MDTALFAVVGSALAILSSSGVVAAVGAALSRFLGKRAGNVESELIRSLGLLEASADTRLELDLSRDSDSRDSERQPSSATPSERDSVNNIIVNFGNEKKSAEAIAEVVRQHSEAHTRLIIKYYAQGYQQAMATFIASLTFAVAGFGVVIWACVYLFENPLQPEPAAISAATGLVTQAVGYLFFRRADKARKLMTDLIDKLRADRDQEVRFIAGLASISAIETASLRDAVKVATVSSLLNIPHSVSDLEMLAKHSSEHGRHVSPVVNIDARPGRNGHGGKANSDGDIATSFEEMAPPNSK